ncbi:hypothetical protein M427DRAFT_60577 [Gonapodya prolifera JEL478]|uniref:Uncharacterized protein n=1 Tax=Gonapodya prolifera (strain JEL478) TaxID=1344416 RepID=A0A139A441_GONPJ|nr:hypothetical protein M427DRAFT_60577 [Gonapodya prolifera JEL478]|eukprot:KXS11560.1 hypothetical protein M427DRAFT_60577 [Gonapodya prolifera JEL478]
MAVVVVKEGNSMQGMEQTMYYALVSQQEWSKTICETVRSRFQRWSLLCDMAFKQLGCHSTLFSFDLPHRDYGPPARAHVNRTFPGRFYITDGDSTVTLPRFREANADLRCDLIHVDGGHSYEVAIADLRNFYHKTFRNDT